MKRMKKVLAALVMACMLCPALSMVAYAAPAELRFTDPSTTVGAEVEVTAKLSAQANVQSFEATLTYDSSMLKFQSGDQATGGDGTITFNWKRQWKFYGVCIEIPGFGRRNNQD